MWETERSSSLVQTRPETGDGVVTGVTLDIPVRTNSSVSGSRKEPSPTAPLAPYHQPPPSYRPRPPLFPVPPPGSCLLPPPPLNSSVTSGHTSPVWLDKPTTITKSHSWPRTTGQETSQSYNYHRSVASLPPRTNKTFLEVPLQTKPQSSLDPNCRPFTPASTPTCNFRLEEDEENAGEEEGEFPVTEDDNIVGSYRDTECDCPLPQDPSSLLPDLDSSSDSVVSTQCLVSRPNTRSSHITLPRSSHYTIHPAPILPLTNCWGPSRPPLLPTPPNFPPYGPRSMLPLVSPTDLISFPSTSRASDSGFTFPDCVSRLTWQRLSCTDTDASLSPAISDLEARYQSAIGCQSPEPCHPAWSPDLPPPPIQSLLDPAPEVPEEYFTSKVLKLKLAPMDLAKSHTDLLFFLFHAGHGDNLQLVAASLLFDRGWRYHTKNQVWLARWPRISPEKKTTEWEEGLYQYFDPQVWRRTPGNFRLYYSDLAEKSKLSPGEVCLITK